MSSLRLTVGQYDHWNIYHRQKDQLCLLESQFDADIYIYIQILCVYLRLQFILRGNVIQILSENFILFFDPITERLHLCAQLGTPRRENIYLYGLYINAIFKLQPNSLIGSFRDPTSSSSICESIHLPVCQKHSLGGTNEAIDCKFSRYIESSCMQIRQNSSNDTRTVPCQLRIPLVFLSKVRNLFF